METNSSFLEKTFSLNERKTNAKTEFFAGLTTFMTMSYILVVNPNMLSETGMDKGGVFTATIISSIIAMILWDYLRTCLLHFQQGWG